MASARANAESRFASMVFSIGFFMVKAAKLSVKHYTGIGRVAVEWAKLEYLTVRALATLLDIKLADSVAVFWHMSFKERKTRLANLICLIQENENDNFRKEFDTLNKRIDAAETIRNIVVHSVWVPTDKKGVFAPLIMSAKGGPIKVSGHNLKWDNFDSTRLKGEAEKISRLLLDFKGFFSAHYPDTFLKEK